MKVAVNKSIAMRLTVSLACAIALVYIFTIVWQYMGARNDARLLLHNKADTTIEYLIGTLRQPLWDYDDLAVRVISRTILQDKSVSGLEITDADANVIFSMEDGTQTDTIFRSGRIVYSGETDGHHIGDVQLRFSTIIMDERLSGFFREALLRLAVVLVTIILITKMLIRIFFKKPLLQLIDRADAYGGGNYRFQSSEESYSEFASFENVLAQMGEQIQTQLSDLKKNEEELRKHRDHLEELVNARTRELTEAKEKAEAANLAKSRFLANMSHELRTPLNAILGYSQILQRENSPREQRVGRIKIIQESGEHLLMLINDILDLAKIEAGKMGLKFTEIHLPSFLEGIAGIIRMRAGQKGIVFTFNAADTLPAGILGDETRLRQVLLNLLGNAVKFTDTGGVVLRVADLGPETGKQAEKRLIRFEVEDTGIGIAPGQLEQIFQPFEQAGDATRRKEGTGLGLSISRQLIDMMGGGLQVRSRPEKGSLFRFEIDFQVASAVPGIQSKQNGDIHGYQAAARRRLRVLVVDDKPHNRSILADLLVPLGFEVSVAEDGREAISQARTVKPDLIFMDLVMPVMTGFEAVLAIREIRDMKNVAIIAVSASVFEMDKQASLTAGFDAFLSKPVKVDEMFALMRNHLRLEWIYSPSDVKAWETGNLIPECFPPGPPGNILNDLYKLARLGDMPGVEEQAGRLAQREPRFSAFARLLREMAENLDDERLIEFIEHYLEEKK